MLLEKIGVISRVDFQNLWLNSNLEDKVVLEEVGSVMFEEA